MPRLLSYSLVARFLGLLLLIAGALKLYGLVDSTPPVGLFSSPRWQVLIIEVEILLAFWLFSDVSPKAAWFAASCFFALMAAVSLYLALAGSSSCGCLGPLRIHPSYTLVADILALASLWKWRPSLVSFETASGRSGRFHRFLSCASALVVITGIYLMALPADSALAAALARFREELVVVEPRVSDLGEGRYGDQREFEIQVRNYSDRPVRILGGTADCLCVATRDLPAIVPEGGTRKISVTVAFAGSDGLRQRAFKLYTDHQRQFVVIGRYLTRIVAE